MSSGPGHMGLLMRTRVRGKTPQRQQQQHARIPHSRSKSDSPKDFLEQDRKGIRQEQEEIKKFLGRVVTMK
eukprot:9475860-Pyramimonas_sp.AAC.1